MSALFYIPIHNIIKFFCFLHIFTNTCYLIIASWTIVKFYTFLMYVSWSLCMPIIYLYTYWSFVYLIWSNVYSDALPIFKIWLFFFLIPLEEFFIYSRYKSRYPYEMYALQLFLPFWGLSFHFLDSILWKIKFLILMKFSLSIFSFIFHVFWCHI